MKCPHCLNEDRSYFYKGSKGWYCRRCIGFSRVLIEEEQQPVHLAGVRDGAEEYLLRYPLTPHQAALAGRIVDEMDRQDVVVKAVCGAGKTEIVVPAIAEMLRRKKKVCFAIARRQVVLELAERLQQIFPSADVTAVCGGHTGHPDGDLIVATTHQLYRYTGAFDLLILDEPDAFPFNGDPVLHGIARTACRGHRIYLTATPDDELQGKIRAGALLQLELNERPHGHPLPVPHIAGGPLPVRLCRLLTWLRAHRQHPRIVFVPTRNMAEILSRFLGLLEHCACCTGATAERDAVIERYRKQPHGLIVATTVLERGVTIAGVDICVYAADHDVFSPASLIQMAGRAGRTFACPDGDVLFIEREYSRNTRACRTEIERANQCAA